MRFKAKRGAIRNMTLEQEYQMVLRQRNNLLRWLKEREGWCPLVEINDVRAFFPMDPLGEQDPDPNDRYPGHP